MGKEIFLKDIGSFLKDGMTLCIGGFLGCGSPHNIIDEIAKTDVQNLTLISSDTGIDNYGIGKLISKKKIKKLYASHIGTNKATQEQMLEGFLDVELVPQGTLAERIRAASCGLGGILTKVGLGTEVCNGKEIITVDGQEYLLERPLYSDIALLKAYKADTIGNLIYNKAARNFNVPMAGSAKISIAEVQSIVEVGKLDPNFIHTPFIYINHIVKI